MSEKKKKTKKLLDCSMFQIFYLYLFLRLISSFNHVCSSLVIMRLQELLSFFANICEKLELKLFFPKTDEKKLN